MATGDLAAVAEWVTARLDDFHSPVQVHFDELGVGYTPSRAADIAEQVATEALRALGPRLDGIKPVVSLPLRETKRLVHRPPAISRLASILDPWTPPSLTLVSRDVYGRITMLMENYETALRLDRHPIGVVVWFYRTWRLDPEQWSRSLDVEHWLEVGPGKHLPEHG